MMEVRLLATSGLKTHDVKTCHSMLEKFVPLEFKDELFWEGVSDSIKQFVCALVVVRSIILGFSIFKELC